MHGKHTCILHDLLVTLGSLLVGSDVAMAPWLSSGTYITSLLRLQGDIACRRLACGSAGAVAHLKRAQNPGHFSIISTMHVAGHAC